MLAKERGENLEAFDVDYTDRMEELGEHKSNADLYADLRGIFRVRKNNNHNNNNRRSIDEYHNHNISHMSEYMSDYNNP